jgi:hypothetical protein
VAGCCEHGDERPGSIKGGELQTGRATISFSRLCSMELVICLNTHLLQMALHKIPGNVFQLK